MIRGLQSSGLNCILLKNNFVQNQNHDLIFKNFVLNFTSINKIIKNKSVLLLITRFKLLKNSSNKISINYKFQKWKFKYFYEKIIFLQNIISKIKKVVSSRCCFDFVSVSIRNRITRAKDIMRKQIIWILYSRHWSIMFVNNPICMSRITYRWDIYIIKLI